MGAESNVYNLYKLSGFNDAQWLILKAIMPRFSNASQTEEDEAYLKLEKIFDALLSAEKLRLSWTSADLIATSEGAYPTGDKFYQEVSPLLCEVWLTLDTKHKKYFTFGEAATEEAFWEELLEDHQSGDLWGYEEFARPAQRVTVLFVSSNQTFTPW
jgi:hypothetical protein